MKLKKILLVEDNQNDIDLAILALSELHTANRIVVVRDGVEAMEYLKYCGEYKEREPGNPAVIFLDLKMPRMDGICVLKEVRNDPQLKTIPVVMVSSSREEKDLVSAYNLGVNAYVVKPVEFDLFTKVIRQSGEFWTNINETPDNQEISYSWQINH